MALGVDFDAEMKEFAFGLGGKILGIGGQDARAVVEKQDARLGWVDVAKIVAHVELGDIADGAGKFDAGRAAADDDEIERRMPAVLLHLALGEFEGEQHAAADLDGVFNAFEAGSEGRPFVFAEVGVSGAGGEDEIVVAKAGCPTPRLTRRA